MVKSLNQKEITRPCIGCGYCCIKAPCSASVRLYPTATLCPQLFWVGDRYECGLMKIGGLVGESYKKELYEGAGCCSPLNSWRKNPKPRMRFDARSSKIRIDSVLQAFLKAISSEFINGDVLVLALIKTKHDLIEYQNYSKEEANLIIDHMKFYMKQNRSSFLKEFMG